MLTNLPFAFDGQLSKTRKANFPRVENTPPKKTQRVSNQQKSRISYERQLPPLQPHEKGFRASDHGICHLWYDSVLSTTTRNPNEKMDPVVGWSLPTGATSADVSIHALLAVFGVFPNH
jgi:hypothetical protein